MGKVLLNEGTQFETLNGQILRYWVIDGKAWFSGVDIKDATGLANLTRRAGEGHERHELLETSGGIHRSKLVSMWGLLRIAFRTDRDPAKITVEAFCSEVLRIMRTLDEASA
jgi:prophage antirepressor-like protein